MFWYFYARQISKKLQTVFFFPSTFFLKSVNVINGDGKGGKLGDLTNLTKHFSQINTNDFFLDHVTGDLYSYNFDKNEWTAKANTGIHYEKAAQEFYTLGKFIINTPPYRVKSLNSLETLFISKNTESICYLKKSHLSHYLFQLIPFEFLISNKSSWVIHTFTFVNSKKAFTVLAETKKGACIIDMKNAIGVECEISDKYPCTILLLRNFILHHLKMIKAFNRNSEDSIVNFYYKSFDPLHEKEINKKKTVFFESRRKINFDVFVDENTTKNWEDLVRFHHVGYSATNKLPQFIEKNTILDNKFSLKIHKRITNINSSHLQSESERIKNECIKTEENSFREKKKANDEDDEYSISLSKSKIRTILHPNLSDACLKDHKLWVIFMMLWEIFTLEQIINRSLGIYRRTHLELKGVVKATAKRNGAQADLMKGIRQRGLFSNINFEKRKKWIG